jgi:DNA-binding beta-propeller fold protein YncE
MNVRRELKMGVTVLAAGAIAVSGLVVAAPAVAASPLLGVLRTIAVSTTPAANIQFDHAGTAAYVVSGFRGPGGISRVDLASGVWTSVLSGNLSGPPALQPDGTAAWVGTSDGAVNTIEKFSTSTGAILDSFDPGSQVRQLSITPDGRGLLAVLAAHPTVTTVINPATHAVVGTIAVTSYLQPVFTPNNTRSLLATSTAVVIANAVTGAVVKTVPAAGVSSIAVSPDSATAYAEVAGTGIVDVINIVTGVVSGTITLPHGDPAGAQNTIGVSSDGSTLYTLDAPGSGNPTVSVIDIATKALAQTLTISPGANPNAFFIQPTTLAVAPSGKFYVSEGLPEIYEIGPAPNAAPVITQQPTNSAVALGATASFTSLAIGSPAPTVQWFVSGNGGATYQPIAGATSTTLVVPNVPLADNGAKFRAVFTNSHGSTTSNSATLTINKLDSAALLTATPDPSALGSGVTLAVVVTGTAFINPLTPTGTVSFSGWGGTPVTATLVGGKATVTINGLGSPSNDPDGFSVTYPGDANFGPSTGFAQVTVRGNLPMVFSGTVIGTLTITGGQSQVIRDATITGGVFVDGAGSVDIEHSTIGTGLLALGAQTLRLCNSTVNGKTTIAYAAGYVLAGAAADGCAPNTLNGDTTIMFNAHGAQAYGNTITGTASYYQNSGSGPFPTDLIAYVGP